MKKLSEYAEARGVSYETIRQSVARYAKELEGHVMETEAGRMIDEYAEDFLDRRRRGHPVAAIMEANKVDLERMKYELEEARAAGEKARQMILELQQQIIQDKDRIADLISEQKGMIEDKAAAEANKAIAEARLQDQTSRISDLEKQLAEERSEVESYVRTLFGLYRKMKK